ncbi:uncharacterized protein LTR77_001003 [Saxophila tyrrhenica]|uniref:Uncharacterized protein n=1 Tax=Saxophila tyrrhenica TaxID=1690608 RepID=A0AAV9PRJ0_9PEZI|nr:hypothetical protein LTR77_001003 [Saxophila tyrrhenica]
MASTQGSPQDKDKQPTTNVKKINQTQQSTINEERDEKPSKEKKGSKVLDAAAGILGLPHVSSSK